MRWLLKASVHASELEKALAASENTNSSLSERNCELQAEVTDYLLQFSKFEQEINALQLVRTSLEGCEGKTQQEVTALRLEISKLQSQLMEVQRELHQANAQVDQLEITTERAVQTSEREHKDTMKALQVELGTKQHQLDASEWHKQQNAELRQQLSNLQRQLQQSQFKSSSVESQLEVTEWQKQQVLSNLEQQATIKGAHIAELADQNKNYNLELNQANQLLDALGTELREVKSTIAKDAFSDAANAVARQSFRIHPLPKLPAEPIPETHPQTDQLAVALQQNMFLIEQLRRATAEADELRQAAAISHGSAVRMTAHNESLQYELDRRNLGYFENTELMSTVHLPSHQATARAATLSQMQATSLSQMQAASDAQLTQNYHFEEMPVAGSPTYLAHSKLVHDVSSLNPALPAPSGGRRSLEAEIYDLQQCIRQAADRPMLAPVH